MKKYLTVVVWGTLLCLLANSCMKPPTTQEEGRYKITFAYHDENQYMGYSNCSMVSKIPDKEYYDYGEEVTLTAVPKLGHVFQNWKKRGDEKGKYTEFASTATTKIRITENVEIFPQCVDDGLPYFVLESLGLMVGKKRYESSPSYPWISWVGAENWCSYLGIGGYTDWRLPTLTELDKLSSFARRSELGFDWSSSNNDHFGYYWSSTSCGSGSHYCINIKDKDRLCYDDVVWAIAVRTYRP